MVGNFASSAFSCFLFILIFTFSLPPCRRYGFFIRQQHTKAVLQQEADGVADGNTPRLGGCMGLLHNRLRCVSLDGCEARENTTRRREAANRSDEIQPSSGRSGRGFGGVRLGRWSPLSPSIIVPYICYENWGWNGCSTERTKNERTNEPTLYDDCLEEQSLVSVEATFIRSRPGVPGPPRARFSQRQNISVKLLAISIQSANLVRLQ
uniref:Putative secreted protein n=1 Tax=Anopheles darlingi TaxID=43151 RepID=A0A2M4DFW0_ANODA